ncbi:hypothetical protein [Aquimarina sp. MMG016]|uniref:hypothetical protein n=1 Tax=Aquimarina sp. MMG016 TaxID=2822690 RepID=UPI001B3A3A6E|nr:hypothetical protein [Aquimarina sp. MMG016]MBQ4820588.1 hypothetical protein [Aquimarina sp. MMG016]
MQDLYKNIKFKVIMIIAILMIQAGYTQIVTTSSSTQNTQHEDILSQRSYNDINSSNAKLLATTGATTLSDQLLVNRWVNQNRELISYNPTLLSTTNAIIFSGFVDGVNFNPVRGYNSYGYIQRRYSLINPTKVATNLVIRRRFQKKFLKEKELILNYLRPDNPIPEGERQLLILSALEKVINITLENEDY